MRLNVRQHIFLSCRHQKRRNLLLYLNYLRLRLVCVEISHHQKFQSLGALSERCDDALYPRGVARGEVTSNDVPPSLPCNQLKADEFGSKLLDALHFKPQ